MAAQTKATIRRIEAAENDIASLDEIAEAAQFLTYHVQSTQGLQEIQIIVRAVARLRERALQRRYERHNDD